MFDAADKEQVSASTLQHAFKQRKVGGKLCSRGETAEGVKALRLALRDIKKGQ